MASGYLHGIAIRGGSGFQKQGLFAFDALRRHLTQARSGERLAGRQQTTGAVFSVGVVFLAMRAGCGLGGALTSPIKKQGPSSKHSSA
jgi:hypothetical protein